MNAINPVFTRYPDRFWGTWADPNILHIGTEAPFAVAAEDSPAGRRLAIEAILDALLHGGAERR